MQKRRQMNQPFTSFDCCDCFTGKLYFRNSLIQIVFPHINGNYPLIFYVSITTESMLQISLTNSIVVRKEQKTRYSQYRQNRKFYHKNWSLMYVMLPSTSIPCLTDYIICQKRLSNVIVQFSDIMRYMCNCFDYLCLLKFKKDALSFSTE